MSHQGIESRQESPKESPAPGQGPSRPIKSHKSPKKSSTVRTNENTVWIQQDSADAVTSEFITLLGNRLVSSNLALTGPTRHS